MMSRFFLGKCCLQIHMKNVPALDRKAETTPGCSRTVCLLIILLLVLKTPEGPASLGLQKVAILVSLRVRTQRPVTQFLT